MFNLVRDNFDANSDDILNSINKMLEKSKDKDEVNEGNKRQQDKKEDKS